MSRDIKQLRPQKNSRYEQGYINPVTCKKVFESQQGKPIIFRSSLEKRFMWWCENNDEVVRWGSECVRVPYTDPRDGSPHTYNPDFLIEMKDGRRLAIEIKPYQQTRRPAHPLTDDWQWNTYIINQAKWRAAKDFFSNKDIGFIIVTERFFK